MTRSDRSDAAEELVWLCSVMLNCPLLPNQCPLATWLHCSLSKTPRSVQCMHQILKEHIWHVSSSLSRHFSNYQKHYEHYRKILTDVTHCHLQTSLADLPRWPLVPFGPSHRPHHASANGQHTPLFTAYVQATWLPTRHLVDHTHQVLHGWFHCHYLIAR